MNPILGLSFISLCIWAALKPSTKSSNPKPFRKCPSCGEPLTLETTKFHATTGEHLGGKESVFVSCRRCRSTTHIKRDLLSGGLADYVPDSAFDREDLEKGIAEELEHTKNRQVAKEIAKDHLLKDPGYYNKRKKNPLARCVYTMHVRYKSGKEVINKDFPLMASTMPEAQNKARGLLKKLRASTIERMTIEVDSCS